MSNREESDEDPAPIIVKRSRRVRLKIDDDPTKPNQTLELNAAAKAALLAAMAIGIDEEPLPRPISKKNKRGKTDKKDKKKEGRKDKKKTPKMS